MSSWVFQDSSGGVASGRLPSLWMGGVSVALLASGVLPSAGADDVVGPAEEDVVVGPDDVVSPLDDVVGFFDVVGAAIEVVGACVVVTGDGVIVGAFCSVVTGAGVGVSGSPMPSEGVGAVVVTDFCTGGGSTVVSTGGAAWFSVVTGAS